MTPIAVRPDLEGLAPYVSPQRPARYRLNTNESPYPPPEGLVTDVADELRRIALNRYPDRDARGLFDAISKHTGWPAEGIWVANGSNEVFLHLFLCFGGPQRTSLTFQPSYPLHTLIPRIAGTKAVAAARRHDMRLDLDAATAALDEHRPDIVIVCSPNNPSGGTEPAGVVGSLAERCRGIVVVDEAYIEFAEEGESLQHLLHEYANVVVTRSFSKAWRLAGARIGYMMAPPELIEQMARVRLPYHLSAITQVIGEAALRYAPETMDIARSIATERARIAAGLQAMGVRTFPSSANFVLFRVDGAREVWQALCDRDVLVRDYSGVAGLEGCLRVTAGTREESDAFLQAMREMLDA